MYQVVFSRGDARSLLLDMFLSSHTVPRYRGSFKDLPSLSVSGNSPCERLAYVSSHHRFSEVLNTWMEFCMIMPVLLGHAYTSWLGGSFR